MVTSLEMSNSLHFPESSGHGNQPDRTAQGKPSGRFSRESSASCHLKHRVTRHQPRALPSGHKTPLHPRSQSCSEKKPISRFAGQRGVWLGLASGTLRSARTPPVTVSVTKSDGASGDAPAGFHLQGLLHYRTISARICQRLFLLGN